MAIRVAALAPLLAALAAGPVGAQPDPPCPPGVPAGVSFTARGDLRATHTITPALDTSERVEIEDYEMTLPPGVQRVRSGPSPSFRSDFPGPVRVVATWQELYDGSFCTATTETTFLLNPATPPRFIAPRTGKRGISELDWMLRIGDRTDLRPVEVRLRGVQRARLPGPAAPVQTLALGLREGDPNRMLVGTGRVLRSAGWRFRVGPYYRGEFPIRMSKPGKPTRRGFGFVLELVQGGVRIGRTRAVGRCEFTVVGPLCTARTMR